MKPLLAFVFIFSAFSAFAAPRYDARKTTCSDLKQALENYGEIAVRSRNLILARTTLVAENPRCGALSYKKEARFRTLDSISCQVGYTCEEDRSIGCYPGNNPTLCQ